MSDTSMTEPKTLRGEDLPQTLAEAMKVRGVLDKVNTGLALHAYDITINFGPDFLFPTLTDQVHARTCYEAFIRAAEHSHDQYGSPIVDLTVRDVGLVPEPAGRMDACA